MIVLNEIFEKLQHHTYCVIKLPETFPDLAIRSDLDIFCYNIEKISQVIISTVDTEFDIKIDYKTATHIHCDVMNDKELVLRFDLYQCLPTYTNLQLKAALFESVLEGAYTLNKSGIDVKVPGKIDEILLRYIEYHEWYAMRPDKIKHIDYIIAKANAHEKEKLIEKIHYYTKIPQVIDILPRRDFPEEPEESTFQKNKKRLRGVLDSIKRLLVRVVKRIIRY